MISILVPFSIVALMTSIFLFRFRTFDKPKYIVGYFTFFFFLELGLEKFILPEGALGIEMAVVCLSLTGLFIFAIRITRSLDEDNSEDRKLT